MAYVILPSRRKRPDNFVLDHSHPLAQGLRFCGIPQRREPLLRDSSLLRKDGVFTNMTIEDCTFDPSISEFALSFNGVSKKVLTPSIGSISKDGPWTVSFFILNPTGSFGCASSYGESVSFYPHWQIHGNDPNGFLHATTFNVANTRQRLRINVDRSVWAHIALVRLNSSSISLYGNAINAALAGTWDPSEFGEDRLIIGDRRTINSSPFTGRVARFCIHNRSLSQEEIAILANKTDPMLAGMIRDKKPAPKHWFMPIPDDCKVKSVVPVRAKLVLDRQMPDAPWSMSKQATDLGFALVDIPGKASMCPVSWRTGNIKNGRGPLGNGLYIGGYSSGMDVDIPDKIQNTTLTNEMTLVATVTTFQFINGTYAPIIRFRDALTNTAKHIISFTYNGTDVSGYFRNITDTASASGTVSGAGAVPTNVPSTIVVTTKEGVGIKIFSNGKLFGSHWSGGSLLPLAGLKFGYGSAKTTIEYNPRMIIHMGAFAPVALKDSDAIALSLNPFMLVDPMMKKRTIYSFASKHNIVGTQDANTLNWTWGE